MGNAIANSGLNKIIANLKPIINRLWLQVFGMLYFVFPSEYLNFSLLLLSINFRLANIIKTILTSEDRYKNLTKLKHVFPNKYAI